VGIFILTGFVGDEELASVDGTNTILQVQATELIVQPNLHRNSLCFPVIYHNSEILDHSFFEDILYMSLIRKHTAKVINYDKDF
jgi:hypothetical protein